MKSGRYRHKSHTDFLNGEIHEFRYAPIKRISGWSVRMPGYFDDNPVRIEYVCPHCGYVLGAVTMKPGWKGCICPDCDTQSDYTVSNSYPHGYRYGDNLNDGKELYDDGYFNSW